MDLLQDSTCNVTALVDTSGTVQERYIQDPFRSFTVLAANWTTRGSSNYGWVYFFQGKRYDFATGLYASRARDYSPTLGRFAENDPLGFGGGDTNLCRAVGNDPSNFLDRSGSSMVDEYGLVYHPRPVKPPRPGFWSGVGNGLTNAFYAFNPVGNAMLGYTMFTTPGASSAFWGEIGSGLYNVGVGVGNFAYGAGGFLYDPFALGYGSITGQPVSLYSSFWWSAYVPSNNGEMGDWFAYEGYWLAFGTLTSPFKPFSPLWTPDNPAPAQQAAGANLAALASSGSFVGFFKPKPGLDWAQIPNRPGHV